MAAMIGLVNRAKRDIAIARFFGLASGVFERRDEVV
jgi:hypothetical protein